VLVVRLVADVAVGVGVGRGPTECIAEDFVEDASTASGGVLVRLLLYVPEVAGHVGTAAAVGGLTPVGYLRREEGFAVSISLMSLVNDLRLFDLAQHRIAHRALRNGALLRRQRLRLLRLHLLGSLACDAHYLAVVAGLDLVLVHVVVEPGNQGVVVHQLPLFVAQHALAAFQAVRVVAGHAVGVGLRFVAHLGLPYHGSASAVEGLEGAFPAFGVVVELLLLGVEAVHEALPRQVVVEVALGHDHAAVDARVPHLAQHVVPLGAHYFLALNGLQVASAPACQGVLVVEDLLEPGVLVSAVELALAYEEGRQHICQKTCICSANGWSVSLSLHLGYLEIVRSLELVLVYCVLMHVFEILKVPGLEVFLERLGGVCGAVVGGRLLHLGHGPLVDGVVYGRPLLQDFAVEDVLALVGLVQGRLPLALELLLLGLGQVLVLLDPLLGARGSLHKETVALVFMPHVDRVHRLDLRECVRAQLEGFVVDLSFAEVDRVVLGVERRFLKQEFLRLVHFLQHAVK